MPRQQDEQRQHVLPGDPPVTVHLRRSQQARRISLRVSGLDAKVTLTLPRGVRTAEGIAFATEKAAWLRQQMQSRPQTQQVGLGVRLPLVGREMQVVPGTGKRIEVVGDEILVPGSEETVGRRLATFFKHLARDHLASASDRYAADLGLRYNRISLRDTRSRWGSCSSAGGLMYSWRLIMAPQDVLEYVVAHEVAHLRHMDHSAAFWAQVRELYGPYESQRLWLREEGNALHRYSFVD